MVLCPVAIAVGCKRCPVFNVCPAKGLIGDQRPADPAAPDEVKPTPKRKAKH